MFDNHGDKVLLVNVPQLTFRRGRMTTGRRTKAIPQLVCDDSGTAGCPRQHEYQFPKAVCDNIGIGANNQPMWACTVDKLPPGVWLGHVTVSCEGYDRSTDPYVLRGSCSLTYALDGNGPDKFSFPGFFVFMVIIFCCCCCLCRRKGEHKGYQRGRGTTLSIPPPAYQADYANATPVLATAVPSNDEDFASKTTDIRSFSQATYDLEIGKGADAPVDSGVPTPSGSTGGLAKTAAAVGTAAAVAATSHIASLDSTLPQGWEARMDYTTGRTYYVNHMTRQTTWTHPTRRQPAEERSLLERNNDGNVNGWGGGWGVGWLMGRAARHNANAGTTTAYGGTHNTGADGWAMAGGGTTIGGTQNRGGDGGGAGSSTAVGGTQNRTDGGASKWFSGWGGSRINIGGTQNRGWDWSSDGGGGGGWSGGGGHGGTSNR